MSEPTPVAEPTQPIEPTQPVEPVQSVEPVQAVEPTPPAEPVQPVDPTPPAEPAPVGAPCPTCGEPASPDERFCESCGADLSAPAPTPTAAPTTPTVPAAPTVPATPTVPPPATVPPGGAHDGTLLDDATAAATDRSRHPVFTVVDADLAAVPPTCAVPDCGGTVAADGYCEQCGTAAPRLRDHWADQPAPWLAGVCDRGVRHTRNEDALAVAATTAPPAEGGIGALVVCDGVSMAPDSDKASLAAVRAGRDALIETLRPRASEPPPPGPPSGRSGATTARAGVFTARLLAAGEAAQARAAAVAASLPETKSPPSCTFVAALVEGPAEPGHPGLLVAGWVGDSRAYWLPDAGAPEQVSTDDSWAAEAIAHGIPREQAETMPQAHAITRWLGADAPDPVPRTRVLPLEGPGWVLVCSDGLWNYRSAPQDMAALVAETAAEATTGDPRDLAERLVAFAIAQGGHDNISVCLARYEPTDK